MVQYDKQILNRLLDSYENSSLFTGDNKVNIRIAYPFTKKNIPAYYDESSIAYEEIHAQLKDLENRGYISIVWKQGKHIVQKVLLNEASLKEIYHYLKRVPKADHIRQTLVLLEQEKENHVTNICGLFLDYLIQKIKAGKSVKEYIDISEIKKTEQLILAVVEVENNVRTCYIREFSIQHFHDSKVFESLLGVLGKIMRQFKPQFEGMDIYEILAEYSIYHTPNYVYFKGSGGFLCLSGSRIALSDLRQGIGISGEDLPQMRLEGLEEIKKVITIENLTTFFRWSKPESILIYLGGYHNRIRRELLMMIYRQIPDAEYLHFGDIDVGGFEIYEDLCEKTGIPFRTLHMDVETIEKYKEFAKKLTQNDRNRLKNLQEKREECSYSDVIGYMMEYGIKLEQESMSLQVGKR